MNPADARLYAALDQKLNQLSAVRAKTGDGPPDQSDLATASATILALRHKLREVTAERDELRALAPQPIPQAKRPLFQEATFKESAHVADAHWDDDDPAYGIYLEDES